MTLHGGRIEVRGWYVGLLLVWLIACVPVLLIGTGMGGPLAILMWVGLNAVLFSPVILAPYGIRRLNRERQS